MSYRPIKFCAILLAWIMNRSIEMINMYRSISIIIPTHQRAELLARTLMSMLKLEIPTGTDVELIVAANACSDQTPEVVQEAAAHLPFPVRCVIEPIPGAARARNTAMRNSNSDYFLFHDDDVSIYPGCLKNLLDAFDQTEADIVLGKVELWWEAVARPDWFDAHLASLLSEVDLADEIIQIKELHGASANMAIRRTLAETVGLFRIGLDRIGNRILSAGETDLIERTMRAGGKVVYTPLACVKHWVAPHRLSLEYLLQVEYGNAYSMMLRWDRPPPMEVARTIVIKSFRYLSRQLRALSAATAGNQNSYRKFRLGAASAGGALAGLIRRSRAGSLAYCSPLSSREQAAQSHEEVTSWQ